MNVRLNDNRYGKTKRIGSRNKKGVCLKIDIAYYQEVEVFLTVSRYVEDMIQKSDLKYSRLLTDNSVTSFILNM